MKKRCFILFFITAFTMFSCKFQIIDYLDRSGFSKENKNLKLYDDYREGVDLYNTNAIFRLNNKIYIRGEKFLDIDVKTYKYLGNGYYKNKNKLYFLDKELVRYTKKDKIETYYKTIVDIKSGGTSCDGAYRTNFYYLEINNEKYINGVLQEKSL